MKPLAFLVRFVFIGIVWSVFFFILWRSLIYTIWGFDAIFHKHWVFMWQMWQDGWVIDTLSEWLFLMSLCLSLPLWILGWFSLMQIRFGSVLSRSCKWLLNRAKICRKKHFHSRVLVITRRKTYRRVRPPALSYVMPRIDNEKSTRLDKHDEAKDASTFLSQKGNYTEGNDSFIHTDKAKISKHGKTVGNDSFDADDNMPLLLDEPLNSEDKNFYVKNRNDDFTPWKPEKIEKTASKVMSRQEKQQAFDSAKEEIKTAVIAKGFGVIENVKVGDFNIDILGLARNEMLALAFDAEEGDWLADEESFGGELPLWFSEEKHRPSPASGLRKAADSIKNLLEFDSNSKITNLLVIVDGNVINAVDMSETWLNLGVNIARAANGMPITLPYVLGEIPVAEKEATKTFVKSCKKVLKGNN